MIASPSPTVDSENILPVAPKKWNPHLLIYGGVVLFGLLLASSPARNLDLWLHIAMGADIASGKERPGPGFLFDLLVWAGTLSVGPFLMVGLKAVAVAFIASRLLLTSGARFPWVSTFGVGLALMAMANRLSLAPSVLSFVFLAILFRQGWSITLPAKPKTLSLLVLFSLWACVDSSFWLGGLVGILLGTGLLLDGSTREPAAKSAWSLISGSFVGLGIWGILEAIAGGFSQQDWYRPTLTQEYLIQAFATPAGTAFFPLFTMCLFAFLLDLPGWRWARVLPMAGLLIAALVHVRWIPWFALVAGPYLALSLTGYFSRSMGSSPFRENHGAKGLVSFFGGALVVLFLLLAWPGWLQIPPFGPRSWGYDPNPSWARSGEVIKGWVKAGLLKATPIVSVSSQNMATMLGWLHPEIRFVVDPALSGEDPKSQPGRSANARGRSDLILVLDLDRARWVNSASRMILAMPDWNLVGWEGSMALFAPNSLKSLPALTPESSLYKISSNSPIEDNYRDSATPISGAGNWWRTYLDADASWTPDRDFAELCFIFAAKEGRLAPGRALPSWVGAQASATLLAAATWVGGSAPLDATLRLQMPGPVRGPETPPNTPLKPVEGWVLSLQEQFAFAMAKPSPAPIYLAIQSLRKASLRHPDDAQARLLLGKAYLALSTDTLERNWGANLPGLTQLRKVQAARAFAEAARLAPDLAEVHLRLGMQYREFGYLDFALEQLRKHEEIMAQMGPPPRVDPGEYLRQMRENSKQLDAMEAEVKLRRDQWHKESDGLRVYDRVRSAMGFGLAREALMMLLASDVAAFGTNGLQLEIQLLLFTGAADQVEKWTESDILNSVNTNQFHWSRVQALAALGQYGSARGECQSLAFPLEKVAEDQAPRILAGLVISQAILDRIGPDLGLGGWVNQAFTGQLSQRKVEGLAENFRTEADSLALAGLLAVEGGENGIARNLLQQANQLYHTSPQSGWDYPSRAMCDHLLGSLSGSP